MGVLLGLAAVSCAHSGPAGPATSAVPGADNALRASSGADDAALIHADVDPAPAQARPALFRLMHLDVYRITVPVGAVSTNEEFWQRVDEQAVDPATYTRLLRNGVRVGVGSTSQWAYFKSVLEQYPVATQIGTITAGTDNGSLELPLKKDVSFEDIFYVNEQGMPYGRSYTKCANLVNIEFLQTPRKQDWIRVRVCPVVRGERTELRYTALNNEEQITEVRPEKIFDMNLEADVRPDHFLVIAPSKESTWPTSIGNSFLRLDGHAVQNELVLLLVPRPFTETTDPIDLRTVNRPATSPAR